MMEMEDIMVEDRSPNRLLGNVGDVGEIWASTIEILCGNHDTLTTIMVPPSSENLRPI